MSATYRCDVCKDPDLNATYTLRPNFPARRYVPGGIEYINYNSTGMFIAGQTTPMIDYSYDLCEACRIQFTELVNTFLGRK